MAENTDKPQILIPGPSPEQSQATSGAERRTVSRFPFTAAAEVVDLRTKARMTGRSSDIGPGGCYVDTISPFAVGTLVRVRLECNLREFEAVAEVSYALVSMGMGMSFTEIRPEHQSVLKDWIAELSGEQSADAGGTATGPEDGTMAAIANMRQVLNELINLMIRKKIISENEGAGLLRQMFHG